MASIARLSAQNELLRALPLRDQRRLLAGCEQVDLAYGQVLQQSMQRIDRVYFPLSGFISLIVSVDAALSLEIGLIGNEGMCGVSLALGVDTSRMQAVVQGAGSALSVEATAFVHACANIRSVERVMKCYAGFLLDQRAQLAACTRYHQVEARLARWMLMTLDRAQADECYLTHQLLGMMLGARRVGITKAAGELQRRGLIQYRRGHIRVLNRAGLATAACSCYAADRRLFAQIMAT